MTKGMTPSISGGTDAEKHVLLRVTASHYSPFFLPLPPRFLLFSECTAIGFLLLQISKHAFHNHFEVNNSWKYLVTSEFRKSVQKTKFFSVWKNMPWLEYNSDTTVHERSIPDSYWEAYPKISIFSHNTIAANLAENFTIY